MPFGLQNWAERSRPSALPQVPLPARLETAPDAVILRTTELPVSVR
jgi:hypothetical protein